MKELNKRFNDYVSTKDQSCIPADLLRSTFQSAVRSGGIKEWEDVVQIYKNPASPAMKTSAMSVTSIIIALKADASFNSGGLCASKDPKIIQKTIDFTRSDVMDQDVFYFYSNLSANIDARRILYEDTLSNWDSVCLAIRS